MGSLIHNAAPTDHHDSVRMHDRREAVGDRDNRPLSPDIGNSLLDLRLRNVVQLAGRLVQHQYRGILQQRAGNRKPLTLTAGKVHPVFVDQGIVQEPRRKGLSVRLHHEMAGHPQTLSRQTAKLKS